MGKLVIKSTTPKEDELRQKAKRWDNVKTQYRQNDDGTRSSHIMSSGTEDDYGIAFPTLFPKDRQGTNSHDKKDWMELEYNVARDTARARGELYKFKDPSNAKKWAKGEYKKN
jgi:hypothetical protein